MRQQSGLRTQYVIFGLVTDLLVSRKEKLNIHEFLLSMSVYEVCYLNWNMISERLNLQWTMKY